MTLHRRIECWLLLTEGTTTRALLMLEQDSAQMHETFRRPVTGTLHDREDPREGCIRIISRDIGRELGALLLLAVADGVKITTQERSVQSTTVFAAYVNSSYRTNIPGSMWASVDDVAGLLSWGVHRDSWTLVAHALGLQVNGYFHSLERQPTETDLHELRRALNCRVLPLYSTPSYHNQHFIAEDGSSRYFVKILPRRRRHYLAEVDAASCLSKADINIPRLVRHGETSAGHCWVAFEWRDIRPFSISQHSVMEAGSFLARMHFLTEGIESLRVPIRREIDAVIHAKADELGRSDPELASTITDLVHRLATSHDALRLVESHQCLIHGNFGWRNLGMDPHARLVLFDFEHAAIGAPILDLAKLWDRELADPRTRSSFLAGYRNEAQVEMEVWLTAIDIVRLWAVTGMLSYSQRFRDVAFERHARNILRQLSATD